MLPVTQTKQQKLGITEGALLRWNGLRGIQAYGMEWLNKPHEHDPFLARYAECTINRGDLVMYIRRVEGVTCWVVYCFKLQKNLLIYNKHFWNYSEIVAKPDEP